MKGMMLGLLMIATMAALWAATPPGLVNYQGVLRTSGGVPITGSANMVFTFYDDSSAGAQILIDSHTGVAVDGGLFTVQLGGGALGDGSGPGTYGDLASVFRDYGTVYVEIAVNGEVLDQRIQVISSAYALNADNLDGLNSTAFAPMMHAHSGGDITSGTVNQSYIDGAVARDAEIMPAVLASDGAGSTLDADTLDGLHASSFMVTGADNWVNTTGDTMTGTLVLNVPGVVGISSDVTSSANIISAANHGLAIPIYAFTDFASGFMMASATAIAGVSQGACDNAGSSNGVSGWGSGSDYNRGLHGIAQGDIGIKYGVQGSAFGVGSNYGGYFLANDTAAAINYGIKAYAAGAPTNWAGWFDGSVNIANGKLSTTASSSAAAGLNLPHGTAPSSPANGDLWTTTSGLYAQINNATVGPFATATGHTHAYLPLAGGTMIGNIAFSGAQTVDGVDLSASAATWNTHVAATANVHGLTYTAEGAGGGLDADLLDGLHASSFMTSATDNWVNVTGDTMTGTLTLNSVNVVGIAANITSNAGVIQATNHGAGIPIYAYTDYSNAATGYITFPLWGISEGANTDGYSIGLRGEAANSLYNEGIRGYARGNSGDKRGVMGDADGTGNNYGGYFTTINAAGTANYGVYAEASGAPTNWAGWFQGNVGVAGGKLTTAAASSSRAGLNLPHGSAPASPANGDVWTTTAGLFARINSSTVGPFTGAGFDHGTLSGLGDDDHTQYFNLSQSETVTGVPAFNGGITGSTAPFSVDSTYGVTNLNADLLDGQHGSYYLNTSTTAQTKNGKLTLIDASNTNGIEAYSMDKAGYFRNGWSGEAYLASIDYGINAKGGAAGGYFSTSAGSGYATVGNQYSGIEGHGTTGGYFSEDDAGGRGDAWIGRLLSGEYWGIRAFGDTGGGYFKDNNSSALANVAYDTYKISGTGSDSFIQNHPLEKDKIIVYMAPEGDEAATYTRGSALLVNGEARVKLGPTFAWVTNPDIGLTAHLTPRGTWADLYVESLSTTDLVVRSKDPNATDIAFDYLVYGLRIGFEEVSVVQNKREEAYIPAMTTHRNLYAAQPDLRAYNALERFKGMDVNMGGYAPRDLSRAAALKNAIHEFDPAVDTIPSEYDQEPGTAADAPGRMAAPRVGGSTPVAAPSLRSHPTPEGMKSAPADRPAVAGDPIPIGGDPMPTFVSKEAVERGDVLVLNPANGDELYKCFLPADPMVVGISGEEAPSMGHVRVIQSDTTWVKADATAAPISRGDLLVASATPGHAMKASNPIAPGTVVGKALEPLQVGMGLIKVLVMLR